MISVSDVAIREATEQDAERLLAYAEILFAEELPGLYRRPVPTLAEERAFIRSYAEPPNSVLLIAERREEVLGLAGLLGRVLPQDAHVGAVGISVARASRGQGIGTLLLEKTLAWAGSHGVSRVEIEAFANNPDAVRLYERVGFQREGVRRGAVIVSGEPIDVICLARLAREHGDVSFAACEGASS